MSLLRSIALLCLALLVCAGAYNLPGVPNSLTSDERLTSALSANLAEEITHEYEKYLKSGERSQRLQDLGEYLRGAHSKKDLFTRSLADVSPADQFFACTMCRSIVNVIARTFTSPEGELSGPNREELSKSIMLDFCDFFSIQTREVCSGLFDLNWPILDYILNETISDSRSFCSMLPITICQAQQDEFNFSIDIKGDMPTESKTDLPARSDKDLRILHLTDIHFHPEYRVGGLADCNEGMCCWQDLSEGSTSTPAGYWSDYRDCDSPRHLVVNAFEHIQKTHQLDWIYHTGDVPPHNVWSTTRQGNLEMLTEIDSLMAEHFPNLPIYSCLGNHEPHPANVFGPDNVPAEFSSNWLYEHVWSLWSKWLPEDTKETILRGGYYTVVPSAGHRIIALNSMDCYLFNWWLFYDGSLVIDQLQWFHDTLLAAEAAGEYVHVLTHIPSGDSDCWAHWAKEYNRIVARFSKIITGIFNGHTHVDEMNLHYTDKGLAVAVSWNGGSLTTYSDKNPNYRIYEVNPETWQVVEHFTHIFNLTAANANGEAPPEWYEEYQFTKTFTEDTSPAGIDKLLVKMAEQPALLRKFWEVKSTNADPRLNSGCHNKCLSSTLCRLATTNNREKTRCRELQAILEEHLDDDNTTTETPPPDDDGASTLSAYTLTIIMGLFCVLRFNFA